VYGEIKKISSYATENIKKESHANARNAFNEYGFMISITCSNLNEIYLTEDLV